jgi:hypothetical protein
MKAIVLGVALASLAASAHATTQQLTPDSYMWGQSVNGLRLGISVHAADQAHGGARLVIAFENTGDADFVLNLGMMLANGKVMLPHAIHLVVMDSGGNTRDLHFFDRRYPAVAGRLDPFTVPLRAGSTYTVATTMNQYLVAATSNFNVRLAGTDRIAARFEGTVAPDSNGDMVGVGLLNFWKGTVQSEFVQFQP